MPLPLCAFSELGSALRLLREEAALTQAAAAERIGITRSRISHYENDRHLPDLETLGRLLTCYGADLEGLGRAIEEARHAAKRWLFVNEDPDWRHRSLIFDEAPEMVEHRRRVYENREGDFLSSRPEFLERFYRRLWGLMKLAPSRRRKEVRRATDLDPKLAELLLEESEKALLRGTAEASDDRARTAEWIVDMLPASSEQVSAIRARSRIVQAAARQLVGKPQEADLLFRSALDALADCPDPLAWAFFFKTLARVREQQRRLPEAAAFLSRACGIYRRSWHSTTEQWCLRRLGRLYLRMNDPGRAMAALAQIRVDGASHRVKAEVFLGLAACMATVDLRQPARLLLRQSRAERRWIWEHRQRLPLEWWDARIALRLGNLEDAIPRLDGVRRELLESQRWADACSASVELLQAYARTGTLEWKGRPDVFGQISQAFQKERSVFDFLPFAEEREPLEAALRDTVEVLERQGFPETVPCRAFLDEVQSLPPSRHAAAILRRRGWGSDWRRSAPAAEFGSTEGMVESLAMYRCPRVLPDDDELLHD